MRAVLLTIGLAHADALHLQAPASRGEAIGAVSPNPGRRAALYSLALAAAPSQATAADYAATEPAAERQRYQFRCGLHYTTAATVQLF